MEATSCDLCKSTKYEVFHKSIKNPEFKEKFRLIKCTNCGLVFVNPRPTMKYIGKYYSNSDYWSGSKDAKSTYAYLYNMIFSQVKGDNILDIGAGTGLFLTEFKRRGWKVNGTEPSQIARKIAKTNFGISLYKEDVLEKKFGNRQFDLITLNNVLEHLHKPTDTVKKLAKMLRSGGYIMISCPNVESLGSIIFGKRWYGVDAPRHLYQFSPKTLRKLLDKSGFKIVKTSHNFRQHNYMIILESFRRYFSPRFSETGGIEKRLEKADMPEVKNGRFLLKLTGILASKTISGILSFVEPIIGRGEIVTILAVKKGRYSSF